MASPDRQPPAAGAATLAGIRRAAEETLAAWPEAKAAVLFGSRARGDHLPSSDWDVAFITRTGDRVTPVPEGMPIEARVLGGADARPAGVRGAAQGAVDRAHRTRDRA